MVSQKGDIIHNSRKNNNSDDNSLIAEEDLKVAVIFPAKNEESTIENVVHVASTSRFNPEIIVVDAYSNDNTAKLAMKAGAVVIQPAREDIPRERKCHESRFKRGNQESSC